MKKINFHKIIHNFSNIVLGTRYCTICRMFADAIICGDCLSELAKISDKACYKCKDNINDADIICEKCQTNEPHFDNLHCKFKYQRPLTKILHQLKYDGNLCYSKFLSYILYQNVKNAKTPDLIIPMPLHKKRLLHRGFNQSNEILLWYKMNHPQVKIDTKVVSRVSNTKQQMLLKLGDRHNNINDAFRLHKKVEGLNIAIVDDVVTTGSTVNELARLLKESGAKQVDVWCLMRA